VQQTLRNSVKEHQRGHTAKNQMNQSASAKSDFETTTERS
jgi:hypothetical protein